MEELLSINGLISQHPFKTVCHSLYCKGKRVQKDFSHLSGTYPNVFSSTRSHSLDVAGHVRLISTRKFLLVQNIVKENGCRETYFEIRAFPFIIGENF